MLKNKETKPLKATLFCVTAYQDNINGFFLSNRSSRVKKELKKDDGYHTSGWGKSQPPLFTPEKLDMFDLIHCIQQVFWLNIRPSMKRYNQFLHFL